MWELVAKLIKDSMLALSVFLGKRIGNYLQEKYDLFLRLFTFKDDVEEPEQEAETLLSEATRNVVEVRTRLHEEIKEELVDAAKKGGLIGWAHWALVAFSVFTSKIRAFMAGIGNLRAQAVNEDLRPSLASIETAVRAWVLNPGLESTVDDLLARWGIPDDQIALYKLTTQNLLSGAELLTLINRELVTENDAIETLRRQGFGRDDAEKLVELRKFYPGPADWATLAGREAFEEDQIRAFDLDSGFDQIDPATYERGGMTSEIARWYWVAHWSNPSIQQLFEMIHRKARKTDTETWSEDDVADYARLADINPIFVKGLTDIAFRPLTRVDVRRMRQDGILTYDDVMKSYTDLGYNPDDAKLMTNWTETWATKSQRNLTRSQLEKMYELRQISRIELSELLESIGYTDDQAETMSLLAAADREDERMRSFIRRYEYEYKRRISTKQEVSRRLIEEDMQADQVNELLDEWDNERVYERALPSKEDLIGWLTGGTISSERFRSGMRALRYTDEDIDLYTQGEAVRLSKTDTLRVYDQGAIDRTRALEGLLSLGYSDQDAQALLIPIDARIQRRVEREQAETDNGRVGKVTSSTGARPGPPQ